MNDRCILCNTPIRPKLAAGRNGEFCCAGCEKVYDVLSRLDEGAKSAYVETARKLGLIPAGPSDDEIPLTSFFKGGTQKEKAQPQSSPSFHGGNQKVEPQPKISPFEKGGRGDFENTAPPIAERTERLAVEGLVCPSCGWVAGEVLSNHPGVTRADVNYFTGTAEIAYDLAATSADDLDELLRPLGYALSPLRRDAHLSMSRRSTYEFIIVAILTMNVMSLSILRYFHTLGYLEALPAYLSYIEGVLVAPILYMGWLPAVYRAATAVRFRRLTMDMLIAIGVGAAASLSYASLAMGRHDMYFETCAGLVTISLLSRMIEARLRDKAFSELGALMKMPVVNVRKLEDGDETYVETRSIVAGETVRFLEGETIPFDGEVTGDRAVVSEAVLTGEPEPIAKGLGDLVTAGSRVTGGILEMAVTRRFDETLLNQITRSIGETLAKQEGHLRQSDRIAAWFIPLVIAVAVAAWAIRALMFGMTYALSPSGWFPSIAVLAVACPCAFSLAGISAVTAATGALLEKGFLVKELDALESLAGIDHAFFDKTGTLTMGTMSVDGLHWRDTPDLEVLPKILAAEHRSGHPAAEAIRAYLTKQGIAFDDVLVDDIEDIPGQGRIARFGDRSLTIGAAALFDTPFLPGGANETHSAVWFGWNREAAGCFLLTDKTRKAAGTTVQKMKEMGMSLALLSGDREAVTKAVAASVGIDDVVGNAAIEDKIQHVKARIEKGRRVAFIGDGTNDALAMSEAHVSVALAKATDEALAASDFVALRGEINGLPSLFRLGRKLSRIIAQNYIWAFAFNTLFIPIAALGKLIPLAAMLLMLVSSVAVLINAARLR